jgi:hypothetical protein
MPRAFPELGVQMHSSAALATVPDPEEVSLRSAALVSEPHHLQIAPGNGVVPCGRYPVNLAVTVRWGGRDRRRSAVDVSAEGMFVESPDQPPPGQLIQIVAVLPGGTVMRGLCAVERAVSPDEATFCGGMPGIGLRFLLMDGGLEKRWSAYLHQLYAGTLPEPEDELDRPEHRIDDPSAIKLTRRRQPRKLVRFRVRMNSKGSLRDFYTQNVSRGGMFIAHSRPLEPGAVLSLYVVHPVTGCEFALQAQVRWNRKKSPFSDAGMGVQLLDCPEEEFVDFINEG